MDHDCIDLNLKQTASATLPTEYGQFRILVFQTRGSDLAHAVLIKGNVAGKEGIPIRVHSECLTGDALFSMKCDCGEQLEEAFKYLSKKPSGVIIYLRQEGRGIGLANKIKAYALQDTGLDTVEANQALGLPIDSRSYHEAAQIIKHLKIKSIDLLTNNPKKLESLQKCGIKIAKRIDIKIKPNKFNSGYLKIKKSKLGHLLTN
ncbi:GTP cyclohydrolase II [Candidatus Micrarchaeota archaeon]|nr:GTP cyclohydrolase II [Candidatus Micrarchaeota archaeon]